MENLEWQVYRLQRDEEKLKAEGPSSEQVRTTAGQNYARSW